MPVTAEIIEKGSPRQAERAFRKSAKAELPTTIEEWHKKYLPRHFKPGAASKYKYRRRSKKYQASKQARGQAQPLVLSGDLREQVLRQIKVSATGTGASGRLRGPRYLIPSNRRRSQRNPDMAAELLAATGDEVRSLSKSFETRVTRTLNELKTVERRPL